VVLLPVRPDRPIMLPAREDETMTITTLLDQQSNHQQMSSFVMSTSMRDVTDQHDCSWSDDDSYSSWSNSSPTTSESQSTPGTRRSQSKRPSLVCSASTTFENPSHSEARELQQEELRRDGVETTPQPRMRRRVSFSVDDVQDVLDPLDELELLVDRQVLYWSDMP